MNPIAADTVTRQTVAGQRTPAFQASSPRRNAVGPCGRHVAPAWAARIPVRNHPGRKGNNNAPPPDPVILGVHGILAPETQV
ncbi:hypothetical protein Pan44_20440 [Caulifigura coniformis]|uniref:Uncharacterized protein n=1 Tax=Caulifigura coniformis TaxID=2527983 RepID=A0A517SD27_9PLAN|nr:hypothetical protein Pan44_20440 [Caulifigura coniformis]